MSKQSLLKKATRVLKQEPDLIIDLYDMHVAYVSKRHLVLTGRDKKAVEGTYARSLITSAKLGIEEFIKDLLVWGHVKIHVDLLSKSGKKLTEELEAHFFVNGMTPYAAVKSSVVSS
ncbi:MAG: hypothetical protein JW834_00290 [Candidatus Diapherotrites archaeon]|nr:hypothetical protein [Candidatus Diapherotrites archaeon]